MMKSSLVAVAVASAFMMAPAVSSPAEAGRGLRKALAIGATVVVTGLTIRCGVRVSKGRSCL